MKILSLEKKFFVQWLVSFGLVFWHINHCSLFNAKSFLSIYNEYAISKHILLKTFLNKHELIFFTQSNHFIYFYQIRRILFTINHLFAHSLMFSRIAIYYKQFNSTSVIYLQVRVSFVLVWFGLMTCQLLYVIQCQILLWHISNIWFLNTFCK